jgi:hypothetical protein
MPLHQGIGLRGPVRDGRPAASAGTSRLHNRCPRNTACRRRTARTPTSTRWFVGRKLVASTMGAPTGLRPERSSTANSPGFTHCFCGSLGAPGGGVSVPAAGGAGFCAEGALRRWSGVTVGTAGPGALAFGGCCCAFAGTHGAQLATTTTQNGENSRSEHLSPGTVGLCGHLLLVAVRSQANHSGGRRLSPVKRSYRRRPSPNSTLCEASRCWLNG